MADDQPPSFWRRLKDRFGVGHAAGPEEHKPPAGQAGASSDAPAQPGGSETGDAAGMPVDEPPPNHPPSPPTPAEDGEPSVLSISDLKTDNVGRVYAQALFELAQEQGVVDDLAREVQDLMPVIAEGGELHRLLTNPAIGDDERGAIIQRVFEGKVSPLLYKMLRVLGDKRRLGSLPQFAAGYLLAVADLRGQVDVRAFVAVELGPEDKQRVVEQIGSALGKTVSLTQTVDPALIGGMKIKVGDRLIDASVASQLRNMKNKMVAAGRS